MSATDEHGTECRKRLMIVAPFSLQEAEQSFGGRWPFLEELRHVVEPWAVDFVGHPQKTLVRGVKSTRPSLGGAWRHQLSATFRTMVGLFRYDVLFFWWARKPALLASLVAAFFPSTRKASIFVIGGLGRRTEGGFFESSKRRAIAWCLKGITGVISASTGEVDLLRRQFPTHATKFLYLRYSAPTGLWRGANNAESVDETEPIVFSGGVANRDFETVIRAVSKLKCRAILVVHSASVLPCNLPANIEVHERIPPWEFARLLGKATCVVVALRDPNVASGLMVIMQALELGKPLIVTAFNGIENYVTDGEHALYVRVGDVEDLKDKIDRLLSDQTLRLATGRRGQMLFNTEFGWRHLAEQIGRIVQGTASA